MAKYFGPKPLSHFCLSIYLYFNLPLQHIWRIYIMYNVHICIQSIFLFREAMMEVWRQVMLEEGWPVESLVSAILLYRQSATCWKTAKQLQRLSVLFHPVSAPFKKSVKDYFSFFNTIIFSSNFSHKSKHETWLVL